MTVNKQDSSESVHRATGPQTRAGKQRSSRNSLKSGIFSKVLFLKGEPHAEYKSLLNDLRESLQPQGMLEAVLVENLAAILWRKRRLLQAENGEISNAAAFITADSIHKQETEVWDRSRAGETAGGMLRPSPNPLLIREAIDALKMFRDRLEKVGFRKGEDPWLLRKLYGLDHGDGAPLGVFRAFQIQSKLATGDLSGAENAHSPEELKKEMIKYLDAEIGYSETQENLKRFLDELRGDYQTLAALIPSQAAVERFVRYEAHLSREFDRTLNQLERVQRMRRGQPGPPTVNVEINR